MPIKSEAQRRKLQGLVKEGKLSAEKFAEMESAAGAKRLPERNASYAPKTRRPRRLAK